MTERMLLDEMIIAAMDDLTEVSNGAYEFIVGPALGLAEDEVLIRRFEAYRDADGNEDRRPLKMYRYSCGTRAGILRWARSERMRLLAGHGALLGAEADHAALGAPPRVRPREA